MTSSQLECYVPISGMPHYLGKGLGGGTQGILFFLTMDNFYPGGRVTGF